MTLVPTSINEASWERLAEIQTRLIEDLTEIKKLGSAKTVSCTGVIDVQEIHREITFAFRQKAEHKGPWLSIVIDKWIAAGSWWLFRAQHGFDQSDHRTFFYRAPDLHRLPQVDLDCQQCSPRSFPTLTSGRVPKLRENTTDQAGLSRTDHSEEQIN
jgi:hypothetical protein